MLLKEEWYMKTYTVDEALSILSEAKITSNKETLRRWLRNGVIGGTPPKSKKEGWRIPEEDLYGFIYTRIPESVEITINTTNEVKNENAPLPDREAVRTEMWWELVNKWIYEGNIEIKKTWVAQCIEHNRHSKEFETYVWNTFQEKSPYYKPRIYYLLDACEFDGQRIPLDKSYSSLHEQILYPVIEYLRKKRVKGKSI